MIFVIFGYPGSGKTTLKNNLTRRIHFLTNTIEYTSRPPRINEKHGIDYFFIPEVSFLNSQDLILIEKISENYYAFSKTFLEIDYSVCILTPYRFHELQNIYSGVISIIYLDFPKEILFQRLVNRGDSTDIAAEKIKGPDLSVGLKDVKTCRIITGSEEDVFQEALQFIRKIIPEKFI